MLCGDIPNFLTSTRPAWHALAACRGMDLDAFFPEVGGSSRQARTICGTCPVRPECLNDALADPELRGIWGATTDGERRLMRRGIRTLDNVHSS